MIQLHFSYIFLKRRIIKFNFFQKFDDVGRKEKIKLQCVHVLVLKQATIQNKKCNLKDCNI